MLELLDVDLGEDPKSIFEHIWGDENNLPYVGNISWQIFNNDSNYFSISIFTIINGTYHAQSANNYTWKSTYDREIELGQLFTENGLQNLKTLFISSGIKPIFKP